MKNKIMVKLKNIILWQQKRTKNLLNIILLFYMEKWVNMIKRQNYFKSLVLKMEMANIIQVCTTKLKKIIKNQKKYLMN